MENCHMMDFNSYPHLGCYYSPLILADLCSDLLQVSVIVKYKLRGQSVVSFYTSSPTIKNKFILQKCFYSCFKTSALGGGLTCMNIP